MKIKKWKESHSIICNDQIHYFGEINSINEKVELKGTGCIYYPESKSYIAIEKCSNENYNGMFYALTNTPEYTYSIYTAGIYKNNKKQGPAFSIVPYDIENFTYKNKYKIVFNYLDDNEQDEGPVVILDGDCETFSVEKTTSNGLNAIRFINGQLVLEKNSGIQKEVVETIDCGWKLNPTIFSSLLVPKRKFGFDKKGYRPAFADYEYVNRNQEYNYYGMLEIYSEQFTYRNEKDKRVFTDKVDDFGIIDYKDGSKYFGEIVSDGNNGDYYREGFGCYRKNNECYIGDYYHSKRHGIGMTIKEGGAYFGSYYFNKKTGLYFIKDKSSLIICNMKDDNRIGNYYLIDSNLSIEERDENDKVLYKTSFANPNTNKKINKPQSLVDPAKLNYLNNVGLNYTVVGANIYITGIKDKGVKELHIPSFVKGVKDNALQGLKKLEKLEIEDGVEVIGKGAFKDCPNINEIKLSSKISAIEPNTFDSKALASIEIPGSVKLIKSHAFSECTNLKYPLIENKNCDIQPHAFPEKFHKEHEKYVKEKEDKNTVSRPKKRRSKFVRILRCLTIGLVANIIRLFILIFKGIFHFFVHIIPDFFSNIFRKKSYRSGDSFWTKVGDFFKMIGKGILTGITFPFRKLGEFCSEKGTYKFIFVFIMGIYLMLGITGWIKALSWNTNWFDSFLGYNWELASLGIELVEKHNFFCAILGFIVTILGGIIDIIVYILIFIIFYIIIVGGQFLLQLVLIFLIPAAIPIYLLITIFKSEEKSSGVITFLITLGLAITYFIFLTNLL